MTLIQRDPILVDDLDGTTEDQRPIETKTFTLEGTVYEVDVHESNARKLQEAEDKARQLLREAFADFIAVARPRPKSTFGSRQAARTDPAQLAQIRDWARARGMKVSNFGKIPDHVREAYEKLAHPSARERAEAAHSAELFSSR